MRLWSGTTMSADHAHRAADDPASGHDIEGLRRRWRDRRLNGFFPPKRHLCARPIQNTHAVRSVQDQFATAQEHQRPIDLLENGKWAALLEFSHADAPAPVWMGAPILVVRACARAQSSRHAAAVFPRLRVRPAECKAFDLAGGPRCRAHVGFVRAGVGVRPCLGDRTQAVLAGQQAAGAKALESIRRQRDIGRKAQRFLGEDAPDSG